MTPTDRGPGEAAPRWAGDPVSLPDDAARPSAARVLWLDVARISAILGVIAIHVVSASAVARTVDVPMATQWIALTWMALVTWCVPLFVMISGALLLQPRAGMSARDFYRRRLGRLWLPMVFWPLVYWGWLVWFRGADVPPDDFIRSVLAGRPYAHLYFLFVIAGLYVITPLIWVFLRGADRSELRVAVVLTLGLAGVQHLLGMIGLGARTNIVVYFVPFVGYYLAGLYLRDTVLDRRGRWLAVGAFIGLVVLKMATAAAARASLGDEEALGPLGYLSFLTIASTLVVFVLIRTWFGPVRAPGGSPAWLATIAATTFGVYLIHPIVLDLWRSVADVGGGRWRNLFVFPLSIAVVWIVSVVLILGLQRIPGVRRLVP